MLLVIQCSGLLCFGRARRIDFHERKSNASFQAALRSTGQNLSLLFSLRGDVVTRTPTCGFTMFLNPSVYDACVFLCYSVA